MVGCKCKDFKKHLGQDITWDTQFRSWLYVKFEDGVLEPQDITECPWCRLPLVPPEEVE